MTSSSQATPLLRETRACCFFLPRQTSCGGCHRPCRVGVRARFGGDRACGPCQVQRPPGGLSAGTDTRSSRSPPSPLPPARPHVRPHVRPHPKKIIPRHIPSLFARPTQPERKKIPSGPDPSHHHPTDQIPVHTATTTTTTRPSLPCDPFLCPRHHHHRRHRRPASDSTRRRPPAHRRRASSNGAGMWRADSIAGRGGLLGWWFQTGAV